MASLRLERMIHASPKLRFASQGSLATQLGPSVIQRCSEGWLRPFAITLPWFLSDIWESILRAVPKKKTSYSKKRSRQLAGKALKDVTALVKCSGCGQTKRAHTLCPHCVDAIGELKQQLKKERDKEEETKLAETRAIQEEEKSRQREQERERLETLHAESERRHAPISESVASREEHLKARLRERMLKSSGATHAEVQRLGAGRSKDAQSSGGIFARGAMQQRGIASIGPGSMRSFSTQSRRQAESLDGSMRPQMEDGPVQDELSPEEAEPADVTEIRARIREETAEAEKQCAAVRDSSWVEHLRDMHKNKRRWPETSSPKALKSRGALDIHNLDEGAHPGRPATEAEREMQIERLRDDKYGLLKDHLYLRLVQRWTAKWERSNGKKRGDTGPYVSQDP